MTTQPTAFHIESFLVRPPGRTLASPCTDPGHHDHIVRVRVLGELDVATAPAVTAELMAAARGHALRASWATQPAIELDLSGLTFLDSSGITALVASRTGLREMGCGLCLIYPRPEVLRLLDLAVCNGWLPPDVECAGYHPWPPVTRPFPAGAGMTGRPLSHRPESTSPSGLRLLSSWATTGPSAPG